MIRICVATLLVSVYVSKRPQNKDYQYLPGMYVSVITNNREVTLPTWKRAQLQCAREVAYGYCLASQNSEIWGNQRHVALPNILVNLVHCKACWVPINAIARCPTRAGQPAQMQQTKLWLHVMGKLPSLRKSQVGIVCSLLSRHSQTRLDCPMAACNSKQHSKEHFADGNCIHAIGNPFCNWYPETFCGRPTPWNFKDAT